MPVERQRPARGALATSSVCVSNRRAVGLTWVVVTIRCGLAALLSRSGPSSIALTGQTATGRAWPAFEERGFDSFRVYYHWVPKGRFSVEYTMRLEHAGRFGLPPTRVEALYAPEIFGELPNDALEIAP